MASQTLQLAAPAERSVISHLGNLQRGGSEKGTAAMGTRLTSTSMLHNGAALRALHTQRKARRVTFDAQLNLSVATLALTLALAATSTTARPVASATEAASSYVGCFADDGHRYLQSGAMRHGVAVRPKLSTVNCRLSTVRLHPTVDCQLSLGLTFTQTSCAAACKGYTYFTLQNGGLCVCGNKYATEVKFAKRPDIECNTGFKPWRSAVFRQGTVDATDARPFIPTCGEATDGGGPYTCLDDKLAYHSTKNAVTNPSDPACCCDVSYDYGGKNCTSTATDAKPVMCSSVGDTHFKTFANKRYDFYSTGLYWLANTSAVAVQALHTPLGRASANAGVALLDRASGKTLTIRIKASGELDLAGSICSGACSLKTGGFYLKTIGKGGFYRAEWSHTSGISVVVHSFGAWSQWMNVYVLVRPSLVSSVQGLCGNTVDSTPVPDSQSVYAFDAGDGVVSHAAHAGSSPAAVDGCAYIEGLREKAEHACRSAGILAQDCIKDVCATQNTQAAEATIMAAADSSSMDFAVAVTTPSPPPPPSAVAKNRTKNRQMHVTASALYALVRRASHLVQVVAATRKREYTLANDCGNSGFRQPATQAECFASVGQLPHAADSVHQIQMTRTFSETQCTGMWGYEDSPPCRVVGIFVYWNNCPADYSAGWWDGYGTTEQFAGNTRSTQVCVWA